jgi:NADH-quinone oxidoreductase subunit K
MKLLINPLLFNHELAPVALGLCFVGIVSFISSRNFLHVLINTEIVMLGINFYLITASMHFGDYWGQVYAICILALTAAETAIGLGLLILLYRTRGTIRFHSKNIIN